MYIIGSHVQAHGQHTFSHTEQRVSVLRRQAVTSPAPATPPTPTPQPATSSSKADESNNGLDKETILLKALVEAMIGKQIDTLSLSDTAPTATVNTTAAPVSTDTIAADNSRTLRIDATQINEAETTQVAFSGQFETAAGAQINLDLQYARERSYSVTTFSASATNGQAKDPLVLNFNGLGAALSPQQTQFDLNSDGHSEALPTLVSGSAYLALDRNHDGRINNGKELFGPLSNNGYAELAKLDSDGNGFIDSADAAFSQLLLFRPGEATQTLASKDIGAIFLGSVASPARLTDSNNQSLGQLRATGFYLTNQGGAGLVQQLDLNA